MNTRRLAFACLMTIGFALSACKPTEHVIPAGTQTIKGTLIAAPLSLTRRGTHVLIVDGEQVYFVESSTVNLRNIENQEVTFTGLVEANIQSYDLPVLVVESVSGVSSSSSSAKSGTGSSLSSKGYSSKPPATGKPCGGAAGILCDAGQYCEITDRDLNIGRCRGF